ncbi:PorP/SprF family type IX secretion system membrane protein [Neolewinella lacunae]|uniref:PorP/SprF family type IX secretion system membrane protein n=1 Tax=Neolewinella lacunae TaxID=1517758 RepID=A0A923PP82_9BACT|nr:PorP/SprF family type IX secretion system membrane protein [Neolewinella lacunae]MBC6994878.1 PorP/SprF family type IX secretion system membrane protein [Neolewinella lacunae]MDN3636798.1 PorP/SprF family type IX secretion system membrane protein [Neolewinella lacunae]
MRCSRLLFLLCLALGSFGLRAQDVHYTLHDYAPLWLNPANTGAFSGSIRAGGIYRGQWHSLNDIKSPTLYVDAPLPFAFRKQDWIGVGLSLVNDNSGVTGVNSTPDQRISLDIVQNFFGFSGSYHLSLDKKRTNIVTLGVQYGSISYGLTPEGVLNQQLNIDDELGGQGMTGRSELDGMGMGGSGGGMGNMNDNNQSVNDLNAGVKLKMLIDPDKNNVFEAGIALLHLTAPKRMSLTRRDTASVPRPDTGPMETEDTRRRRGTIHAHARLDLEMSEKWRFQPTVFFQNSAGSSSISLQAWGSRNLKEDLDLRLGLGYRTSDAAKVMVGFDFAQLRTALSYDITLSQARAVTNFQGAFELSAAYIFNIYKKPTVTPTLLCPRI